MSNLAYIEYYTKDDYELWKGDWELIYGQPYSMSPSPMFGHQYLNMKISRQLDQQLDNCQSCYALFETDVEFSDDTILRPDCMVICYEPIDKITKTPEVIFEVISKSTAKKDETLKFDIYEKEGVKYYILVYPEIKKAKLYKLKDGRYIKQGDYTDEKYTFNTTKCDIEFDFNFIWKK
jgi:Uma2 family endonuclease